MSETPFSGQMSAGVSEIEKDERLRLALVAGAILLSLAIAALLLRLQRLSELPPGLLLDEGIHGASALQVLRGEHTVFFPEKNDGLEGLMGYAVAVATALLGRTVLALSYSNARFGTKDRDYH